MNGGGGAPRRGTLRLRMREFYGEAADENPGLLNRSVVSVRLDGVCGKGAPFR